MLPLIGSFLCTCWFFLFIFFSARFSPLSLAKAFFAFFFLVAYFFTPMTWRFGTRTGGEKSVKFSFFCFFFVGYCFFLFGSIFFGVLPCDVSVVVVDMELSRSDTICVVFLHGSCMAGHLSERTGISQRLQHPAVARCRLHLRFFRKLYL